MKKLAWLLATVFLACGAPARADEFKNVKCGADIPKAMIGQPSLNGRIVVIEAKYRSLGLKHLGADQTSDQLSSISWLICGSEYLTLVDRKGLVRDAIPFPPHSKKSPAFSSLLQTQRQGSSRHLRWRAERRGRGGSVAGASPLEDRPQGREIRQGIRPAACAAREVPSIPLMAACDIDRFISRAPAAPGADDDPRSASALRRDG